jgi:hypothetical protein
MPEECYEFLKATEFRTTRTSFLIL